MSEIKVNKISPATGTETTLGDASDDFLLPSGAEIKAKSGSTITIESGATLANAGTATGFGGGGKVLQVIATNMTVTSRTTTSGSFVDLSGFTADITPAATGSKILCMVQINHGTSYQHHRAYKLFRDSTEISNTSSYYGGSDLAPQLDTATIVIVDSPATTSAVTYKIQWVAYASGTRYLNKNSAASYTALPSTMTLIELESATVTTVSS